MIKLAVIISTFLYIGFIPKLKATIGAICGLVLFIFFNNIGISLFEYTVIIFFIIIISIWSSDRAEKFFKEKDCNKIIIDEIVGILVTMYGFLDKNIFFILLGFFLFRILDLWKPLFINKLQMIKGGLGIVLDDILAGIYANLILRLLNHFLFKI